jgi:hypothetical protein
LHKPFSMGPTKMYLGQPSASVSLLAMNVDTERYAAEVAEIVAAWLARRGLESSVPTSNYQPGRGTAQLLYTVPATVEVSSAMSWAFASVGLTFVTIHGDLCLYWTHCMGTMWSKSDHFEATL